MKSEAVNLARWRGRIFLAAWVLYAAYYICRKDIAPASGPKISHLAISLACFGAAYAIGQLAGGWLADSRFGARRTALTGACISLLCTSLLAWYSGPVSVLALQLGNGLGQGFGWPSLLKLIGSWFRRNERDRVLGWWSTSYILGGLLATSLSIWLAGPRGVIARANFHPAYLISSGLLAGAALFFWRETADSPNLVLGDQQRPASAQGAGAWREIAGNREIRIISVTYFFLKMTRYALLFWLPLYLISSLGYSQHSADHIASCFELSGFLGPLTAGYAVERWFADRRLTLAAGILFALAFVCVLHPVLASGGWFAMTASISVLGILIYAADVLISGMAVLDAVPEALHGRAVGFVNGVGSLGQMISPFLVTILVSHSGWTSLFDLFVFFAIVAAMVCALGARLQTRLTSPMNRSALGPTRLPL